MARNGADLALLLLGGFRTLTDAVIADLEQQGFKDVRPAHDFAMRAIIAGADTPSALGRRLSVSKQAAAKTIAVLEQRGYLKSEAHPTDSRQKRLMVTPLGMQLLRQGELAFDHFRKQWEKQIGVAELERLERNLEAVVGKPAVRFDSASWISRNTEDNT